MLAQMVVSRPAEHEVTSSNPTGPHSALSGFAHQWFEHCTLDLRTLLAATRSLHGTGRRCRPVGRRYS